MALSKRSSQQKKRTRAQIVWKRWGDWRKIVLALGTGLFITALLTFQLLPDRITVKVGQPAAEDIFAPRYVHYPDVDRTRELRDRIAGQVPKAYNAILGAGADAHKGVTDFFNLLDAQRASPEPLAKRVTALRRSLRGLQREGFRYVFEIKTPEEVAQVQIERQPLWNNRRWDRGPFDIIGDVHGCFDELAELLTQMGYAITASPVGNAGEDFGYRVVPPDGRKVVFVGDLVDRGPKVVPVLRLVMSMVRQGHALCLPGNAHPLTKQAPRAPEGVGLGFVDQGRPFDGLHQQGERSSTFERASIAELLFARDAREILERGVDLIGFTREPQRSP